jgi:chaperonin GroES
MHVKVGDTVMYGKYAGQQIELNGEDYLIMREDDVLVIL